MESDIISSIESIKQSISTEQVNLNWIFEDEKRIENCHAYEDFYKQNAHILNENINLPYEEKLERSFQIIERSIKHHEHDEIFVACSFGKDSIVLLHQCLQIFEPIAVFCNTGIEFRENIHLRDKLLKEWKFKYIELKPKKSFWKCVKEYGYPGISRANTRTPACCYHLKEAPMKSFIKEYDNPLIFVGLTSDEGRYRRYCFINKGDEYYISPRWNCFKSIPLIFWTKSNINQYIHNNDIPVSKAYEKYKIERTGCIYCTGHIGWQKQIAQINMKVYKKIMNDLGTPILDEFMK